MSTKISKRVVKLTRLYGLVMITLSKKHKKINCYHLENDKERVGNENNRKKDCDYDARSKSQSSTVDLRNKFIVIMIQKTWKSSCLL